MGSASPRPQVAEGPSGHAGCLFEIGKRHCSQGGQDRCLPFVAVRVCVRTGPRISSIDADRGISPLPYAAQGRSQGPCARCRRGHRVPCAMTVPNWPGPLPASGRPRRDAISGAGNDQGTTPWLRGGILEDREDAEGQNEKTWRV
jgi:hypothetical protein